MASLLASLWKSAYDAIPTGTVLYTAIGFVGDGESVGQYFYSAYMHEVIGSLLMIGLTFSPGKWIGQTHLALNWFSHGCGVVTADYVGGGPNVNPAVSFAMLGLGKMGYTEALVRMAGAMTGGLIAFPLFFQFSETMKWEPLGGPEFNPPDGEDADVTSAIASGFYSEFFATFLLCIAVYILNFELDFGKGIHYWVKQPLTAVVIRYLIVVFSTTGPAMNPMLATAWAVFASPKGTMPENWVHYFVYWLASYLGAALASLLYVVYAGGKYFGMELPVGPIKGGSSPPAAATSSSEGGGQSKKKKKN